jgi:hypothetical protein
MLTEKAQQREQYDNLELMMGDRHFGKTNGIVYMCISGPLNRGQEELRVNQVLDESRI